MTSYHIIFCLYQSVYAIAKYRTQQLFFKEAKKEVWLLKYRNTPTCRCADKYQTVLITGRQPAVSLGGQSGRAAIHTNFH